VGFSFGRLFIQSVNAPGPIQVGVSSSRRRAVPGPRSRGDHDACIPHDGRKPESAQAGSATHIGAVAPPTLHRTQESSVSVCGPKTISGQITQNLISVAGTPPYRARSQLVVGLSVTAQSGVLLGLSSWPRSRGAPGDRRSPSAPPDRNARLLAPSSQGPLICRSEQLPGT